MKKFQKIAMIALLAIGTIACDSDDDAAPAQQTITDIAAANPDFSILVEALTITDLAGVLDAPGSYTVFAPTNAAFNDLLDGADITDVPEATLKAILLNHVIGTEIKSSAIPAASYQSTLSPINATPTSPTISMFVQKTGTSPNESIILNGGATNGGATVITKDVDASNGVIHIIDTVILPK